MVTLKSTKRKNAITVVFFIALCVLAFAPAKSQTAVDATILSTNLDAQSKKLYVEMNYTPKVCGSYQLRFRLETTSGITYTDIELDSVISNDHGTQKISTYTDNGVSFKVLNLDNTAVGGYNLRFALKGHVSGITAADSPMVCLETYRIAYRCRWCGVNRSDILFTPKDLDPQCPYRGDDLVACGRRVGGAQNWEAYVQDPRDCRIYRVVQLPDDKWWFAQNLNYQNDLTPSVGAGNAGSTSPYFFCPGPNGIATSTLLEDGSSNEIKWSCEVYGALYPWYTARRLDGSGDDQPSTAITSGIASSSVRGICPPGWYLPNDADWGIMLNSVEGCATPYAASAEASPLNPPCNHFLIPSKQDAMALSTTGAPAAASQSPVKGSLGNMQMQGFNPLSNATIYYYDLGYQAGKVLKATPTCPTANICDNIAISDPSGTFGLYATNDPSGAPKVRYAFTRWMYADKEASGSDRFGFSVLPAGFRSSQSSGSDVSVFAGRGQYAIFLSSSHYNSNSTAPVLRGFFHDAIEVKRFYSSSSNNGLNHAYSVRCVKP
ncbi:MAG: hypothetical protein LBF67_01900 [Prevotellaceae bacterium]|nr:hypothetical protein [Prevotellaceae bacterium]